MLRGRATICGGLDGFLDDVRAARSRTLVLRGEAGVGKTALLGYVGDRATGCRIVRAAGVESEMELPYAGLHQLCAPLIDRLVELPGPQRASLEVAFGLRKGDPPERLMVGLAVLSLFAGVGEEQPVVCLVDDAHWLDRTSVQALSFVARRLLAEPVGLLFVVRDPDDGTLSDLPTLAVDGLGDEDARILLASAIQGRLDDRVRDRIIDETRGNPLALLELYRGMTPADLDGGFAVADSRPMARRIEESFRRRVDGLPDDTQRILLVAAAEPLGDATLLWRAAQQLGITPGAVVPAKDADLIEVGTAVRFRHPLVRSMVYRAAPPDRRREVHGALAQATDPIADPDRRAWHRGQAAAPVDDAVADELERSADRAQARGGIAAAAAFLERAMELTADPARRSARALAAAELHLGSGALDQASELLAAAENAPHDALHGARLEYLRAQVLFTRQRGRDAPALLLRAAQHLEPLDPGRAGEVYLDAFIAAGSAGHLSVSCGPVEVAQAARAARPRGAAGAGVVGLLLDALIIRHTDGYAAAVSPIQRALRALRDLDDAAALRWMGLEMGLAADLWLDDTLHERSRRHLATARAVGALGVLPIAIANRVVMHTNTGEFSDATALAEEAVTISQATGTAPAGGPADLLAAWRGQEASTLRMVDGTVGEATARGEAKVATIAEYAASVLHVGLGQYDLALAAARGPSERDDFGVRGPALSEVVEAAVRTGHVDEARRALEQLRERTRPSPTDWALGIEARARALVSGGPDTDDLYRESIERLGRTWMVVQAARSHLLYGEWLRREDRRVDARQQLRVAYDMFDAMGAVAFVERARRERLATGESVRKRTDDSRTELTPQERQIAGLAREGHTNGEIATQLFLSVRTVEWHLSKVFAKLGIASRRGLRAAVLDRERGVGLHPR